MKKMTMADIAKVAGVSKTTVSRYFNGGYVKEETRQKIEKIVKEYDYEPNVLAANLKANKTHTVGIVCPTLTSYASFDQLEIFWLMLFGWTCTSIPASTLFDASAVMSVEQL